jgi:hypothetical protein
MTKSGALEAFRFRGEREQDRKRKLIVRFDGERFTVDARPIRGFDSARTAYFEHDWGRFLSGEIYDTTDDETAWVVSEAG